MEKIIGRESELGLLSKYYDSERPEFITLYGRRRVGKTFIVRSFFKDKFDFFATGILEGTYEEELKSFKDSLKEYGHKGADPDNWMDAFSALAVLMAKARRKKRCVIFLDEISCFDTPNSGFTRALGHFWNKYASRQDNVFLIICGSATSWMTKNVLNNKGGLHNRRTHEIHLRPFNLAKTEQYFASRKARWSRLSILQAYMVLGGIPYYLSLLDMDEGLPENIDRLFFSEDAPMRDEYRRLYRSVFKSPERYMDIVKALSANKSGLTRTEISAAVQIDSGSGLSEMLDDLVACDFIRRYRNGLRKNGEIYQLMDFYTLFYLQFCANPSSDRCFWKNTLNSPQQNTWYGLSYERVCMAHIQEILRALHLDTIHTEYYSFRSKEASPKVQIDLVIDRSDDFTSIIEIKYSRIRYEMTGEEREKIERRVSQFINETKTRKGVQTVLITTLGCEKNRNTDVCQRFLALDDLFI
jgi:AAA+ ATPase superfamily predicted ATPase